jgi:DNA polymerase elongation subunit (family B)
MIGVNSMKRKPRILFFDIETSPVRAWTFSLGKQHIGHSQIVEGDRIDIICITYCWETGPAYSIDWGFEEQDSSKVIMEFDKVVKEADIIIGQNSDSFDVKHINTQRMLHKLPPMPDWADCTDDTLKQMKRFFKFPTNRLDYVSELLGFGGKVNMCMQDWINIVEKRDERALDKMIRYGKKDVVDTRKIFNRIKPYIKPKFNMATFYQENVCVHCGSDRIKKNGTRISGKTKYQFFYCHSHNGYAGKAPMNKDGGYGKLGN